MLVFTIILFTALFISTVRFSKCEYMANFVLGNYLTRPFRRECWVAIPKYAFIDKVSWAIVESCLREIMTNFFWRSSSTMMLDYIYEPGCWQQNQINVGFEGFVLKLSLLKFWMYCWVPWMSAFQVICLHSRRNGVMSSTYWTGHPWCSDEP